MEVWSPDQFFDALCEQAKASYELPALIQKLDRYGLRVTSNQPFREAVDRGHQGREL